MCVIDEDRDPAPGAGQCPHCGCNTTQPMCGYCLKTPTPPRGRGYEVERLRSAEPTPEAIEAARTMRVRDDVLRWVAEVRASGSLVPPTLTWEQFDALVGAAQFGVSPGSEA